MLRRCEAFQGLHHGNWANNPFVLIELQLVRSPFKTIVTPFSGSPVRGVCVAGFSQADPDSVKQSRTGSNASRSN